MGRFGIGARVRDWEGDVGVIVGKSKGYREIEYDEGQGFSTGFRCDWPKKRLSLIDAVETTPAPVAAEPAPTATELQIGDRVRFVEDYGRSRTGDEGVITGFWDADSNPKGGLVVELDKGGTPQCYAGRVQKIEPAAVAAPVAAPSAPWEPKVGDRVRYKDECAEGEGEIVADVDFESSSFDWTVKANGEPGAYFYADNRFPFRTRLFKSSALTPLPVAEQPAAEPALWAPVAGKYGKTRDGRKARVENASNCKYPFRAGGNHYNADGTHFYGESNKDLVAEWVEPVAEPVAEPEPRVAVAEAVSESKWKVGDEVLLRDGSKAKIIEVRTPEEIAGGSFPFVHDGGGGAWHAVNADGLSCIGKADQDIVSKVDPAAPQATFKVGDRIVEDKSVGGVDLVEHWNRYWRLREGDLIDGSFVVTKVDDTFVHYSNRLGGDGPICEAFYFKPNPALTESLTPASTGSFIVARLTANGEPRPNVRPRVHASIEAAEAEAQRLADRLGDEFAQQVSSKTVDAGPVPEGWGRPTFDLSLARAWLAAGNGRDGRSNAFKWAKTGQGQEFWLQQHRELTHLGRAILKKWIAEAEATTTEAA